MRLTYKEKKTQKKVDDIDFVASHTPVMVQEVLNFLSPFSGAVFLDTTLGGGGHSELILDAIQPSGVLVGCDRDRDAINICKDKLKDYKNISWKIAPAEKLPFKDSQFDYFSISFGLRNTKNLNKSLSEAYRVLKKGGRFLCLEFSKIDNDYLDFLYQNYSKLVPVVGEFVVGDKKPYEYLVKSIKEFIDQEELIDLMKKNKFEKCKYTNLNAGIVALHSGWKI